jgi:2,5-diketo-D-gluconate reductase A
MATQQLQRNLASAASFVECGVRLNTGAWLPAPGFGTWNVRGAKGRAVLEEALAAGYRHLDTAHMYTNHQDIATVLRKHPELHPDTLHTDGASSSSSSLSSSSTSKIFVTSKFTGHGYAHAKAECERALKELGVSSVDLFLIHWPGQGDEASRRESWRALEELHAAGKCRAIGVSNYTEHHLRQLLAHAKVVPAVNEVP